MSNPFLPVNGTTLPLVFRQTLLFTETCDVYRKARNGPGDYIYWLIAYSVPCYMHTTPNVDVSQDGTGNVFKEEGVFLFNRLNFPISAAIQPEDVMQLSTSGPDNLKWFVARGAAHQRPSEGLRQSNRGMVYLNPDDPPALGTVAPTGQVGPALDGLGYAGDNFNLNGAAEVAAIHSLGMPRLSIPWYLFGYEYKAAAPLPDHFGTGPEQYVSTLVLPAIAAAVANGQKIRIAFHVDGSGESQFGNIIFTNPTSGSPNYLTNLEAALTYIATVSGDNSLITIEVGNENAGYSPEADYGQIVGLYKASPALMPYGIYTECVAACRSILPGCTVCVPAPGDQQMGYLYAACVSGAMGFSSGFASATGADYMSIHYPSSTFYETGPLGAPATYTLAQLLASAISFGGLPLQISETWNISPFSYLVNDLTLGLTTDVWQWVYPGQPFNQVKGNLPILKIMGY